MTLYIEDTPRALDSGRPAWRMAADTTSELSREAARIGAGSPRVQGGAVEFALVGEEQRTAALRNGAVELTEAGLAELVIAKAQRLQAAQL